MKNEQAERVSAEELLLRVDSHILDFSDKRKKQWADLRAELLSRLTEVEELRKQVADLTQERDAIRLLSDSQHNRAARDMALLRRSVGIEHGDLTDIKREIIDQRSKLAAAEAEADRLRKELAYFDKLQADYSAKYASETASRLDWQSSAETLSKRLREMEGALREIKELLGKESPYTVTRSDGNGIDMPEAIRIGDIFERADKLLAESALALPPSEASEPVKEKP